MASKLSQHILKAMGLFGGAQAAVILMSIVRTKLVAVWLGPLGVGLNAIYLTTEELIASCAALGLRTSGVRELSASLPGMRGRTEGVLLRMASVLALCGAGLTLMLSPALSYWSMGTVQEWWQFALLAIAVGAAVYLDADLAMLQASGRLKSLARVTFVSALAGTVIAVPMYYGLRMHGVLPVVITVVAVYALWAHRERRRNCGTVVLPPWREALREAGPMLRLGLFFTLAAVAERLGAYVFVAYMNREAAPGDLGIYQAGYTLVNTYAGVIFTAIVAEYYPRLASVASSRLRTQAFVGQEFKEAAWVLMPVVVVFIAADELMVRVLYAESFMAMLDYVGVAVCGMALRAFSFCTALVMLARGDGRCYIITESASALLCLVLKVAGYRIGGFAGLGAAYVLHYAAYSAMVLWVYRRRYGLRLGRGVPALCAMAVATAFAALAFKCLWGWWAPVVLVLPWLLPLALRRLLAHTNNNRKNNVYKNKRMR